MFNARIIIAAGGTGGHVFPGVAVAQRLKSLLPGVEVVFFGTKKGLEKEIVPALGYSLVFVRAGRIKGEGKLTKLASMLLTPISVLDALVKLLPIRAGAVVSIGGYAAAPLVVAAWLTRVPVFLIEPNAIPGASNRLLSKFSKKVFVAFDEAASYFNKQKVVRSGVPVRKEILSSRAERTRSEKFTVFVFGGSQGARRLNLAMADAAKRLSDINDRIKVIHQTGRDVSAEDVKAAYRNYDIDAEVFDFTDHIWDYYADADIVIGRAGASTVTETMALAIPSILVPYPYAADDHQHANAMAVEKIGGAIVVKDSEFSGEKVASIIRSFIDNPEKQVRMEQALKGLKTRDAAEVIALEVEGVLN